VNLIILSDSNLTAMIVLMRGLLNQTEAEREEVGLGDDFDECFKCAKDAEDALKAQEGRKSEEKKGKQNS